MGITFIYQGTVGYVLGWATLPCLSISLSLNVLLTFMIVVRIALHTKNTRAALGLAGIGGLCNAVITMLIESCALCAVSLLPVIGSWVARSSVVNFFMCILPQTQVRAFLQRPSTILGQVF